MTDAEKIAIYIKTVGVTMLPPVTRENFWVLYQKQEERTGVKYNTKKKRRNK